MLFYCVVLKGLVIEITFVLILKVLIIITIVKGYSQAMVKSSECSTLSRALAWLYRKVSVQNSIPEEREGGMLANRFWSCATRITSMKLLLRRQRFSNDDDRKEATGIQLGKQPRTLFELHIHVFIQRWDTKVEKEEDQIWNHETCVHFAKNCVLVIKEEAVLFDQAQQFSSDMVTWSALSTSFNSQNNDKCNILHYEIIKNRFLTMDTHTKLLLIFLCIERNPVVYQH